MGGGVDEFHIKCGKITDYRVYCDTAPLHVSRTGETAAIITAPPLLPHAGPFIPARVSPPC